MKTFKIRCSQIGEIMTNGRSKSEPLGNTCKTYVKKWMLEQIYNRKIEITSKYMDKGSIVEDESIDFISAMIGIDGLIKNEKYYEDDFMTGTPDVLTADLLIEVKNSWDFSTFPYFMKESFNKDYYWQIQGYLNLTGLQKAMLVYTLQDTPIHLIHGECKRHCWNTGDDFDDVLPDFIKRMTYDDILPTDKIRTFEIERNQEDIDKIIERVKECREYINQLTQ